MAELLSGRVRNVAAATMEGYSVAWNLVEIVDDKLRRAARLTAKLEGSGNDLVFRMELPDAPSVLLGPSRFEVLAPSGNLAGELALDVEATARVLKEGRVELEAAALPPGRLSRSDDPLLGRATTVTGLVLQVFDGAKVPGARVFVWGRPKEGGEPALLVTAQTDPTGYFFCARPPQVLDQAWAAVAGFPETVAIGLDPSGRLPAKLVIGLLQGRVVDNKPPCSGAGTVALPTAPDAEVLATSEAYAEDLGRCVDFTVPNRAIDEHGFTMVLRTTDPEIQGLTLPPPPRHTQIGELIEAYDFFGVPLDPGRIDDWTKGPTAREAARPAPGAKVSLPPTVERALSQIGFATETAALAVWSKKTAGRAPLNAANPVDWDNEPTFYQATTIAHGHLLHFRQVFKANGYSRGELLYSLALAPLQKKQIAIVDWDRRDRASRTELLESGESLQASLTHDRTISDLVNATLEETLRAGSSAETKGRGGAVGVGLAIPVGPVAIPIFGGFAAGGANSSSDAWQDSGRDLAMSAMNTLAESTAQSASALRRQRATVVQQVAQGETGTFTTEVIANNNHCHAMTIEYFEVLRHFIVETRLAEVRECLLVPLLMTRFDQEKALRWREPLQRGLRDARLAGAFEAVERQINTAFYADFPAARYADDPLVELWGELLLSFQIPRPADGEEGAIDPANWSSYEPLLWDTPASIFNLYLAGRGAVERELIFKQTIAPRLAEAFVDQLKFFACDDGSGNRTRVKLDTSLLSDYAEGTPLRVSLRLQDALPATLTRAAVSAIEIESDVALPAYSKIVARGGTLRYRTEHLEHVLFSSAGIENDIKPGADKVRIACPLGPKELRNPRDEDEEAAARLVAHLNEHLEYYHKVIWWYMDPDRRYMLLDGFVAPNSGGRSVASVCENRIAAIVGNSLVLPVTSGFALDPVFRRLRENGRPVNLLGHYAPERPLPPLRISLPTKGVFAEAVLGSCNSCEKIDDSRFWRFEEHPSPNEPTPIETLNTGSRIQPAPNLQPTPLTAPIVAMQAAPAAPDPAGLSGAVQLLGAANLFRDITGLQGNQQNAASALGSALSAATTMGLAAAGPVAKAVERAAEVQKQRLANEHADRINESIDDAVAGGSLSPEAATQLKEELARQRIGTPPAPSAREEAVTQAVTQASQSDKPFTYSEGSTSLSVESPAPAAPAAPVYPIFEQDPNDATKLFSLAALVQPASMVFASEVGRWAASHKLYVRAERWWVNTAGTKTPAGSIDPIGKWREGCLVTGSGTYCLGLEYDGEPVFDLIEWLPLEVQGSEFAGGAPVRLPMTIAHLIADAAVRNSSLRANERTAYRLPLEIEHGQLFVFGWVLGADGSFRPLTELEAANHEFGLAANTYAGEGGAVVVATIELVLTGPDTGYEPSGWLKVARVYPLLGLWCSRDLDRSRAEIRLRRPRAVAASPWSGLELSGDGVVKAALFSELNGIADTGPIDGPYRWDLRYAEVLTDARGQGSFTVVDAMLRQGSSGTRGVWDATAGRHLTQPYSKHERQGAFDALVLAPSFRIEGQPDDRYEAITAPLTPPGAVHVRWRWSDVYTAPAQRGWSGAGTDSISGGSPSDEAGAPMVPCFQTVNLVFEEHDMFEPTFIYRVDSSSVSRRWQLFMHHGCGYVVGTALGIDLLPLRAVTGGEAPTWSSFYRDNRYTTSSGGELVTWLAELDISAP